MIHKNYRWKVIDNKKKKKYIDKQKFYEAYIEWAKSNYETDVPDFIGKCFLILANKIATYPSFYRHPTIEDMKGEAIYQCVKNAKKFDITRSDNPFSYYTECIANSLIQSIKKEKKYAIDKFELIARSLDTNDEWNYHKCRSSLDEDELYVDRAIKFDEDRFNQFKEEIIKDI